MAYAFNDDRSKLPLPLPVSGGGTGASSAANARQSLNAVGCTNASQQNPMLTYLQSNYQHWALRSNVVNSSNEEYDGDNTGLCMANDYVFGYDFTEQQPLWIAYTNMNKPSFSDVTGTLPADRLSGVVPLDRLGVVVLTKTDSSVPASNFKHIRWTADELSRMGISNLGNYCVLSVMSYHGNEIRQATPHIVVNDEAYPYVRLDTTSEANTVIATVYNSGSSATSITAKVVLLKIA